MMNPGVRVNTLHRCPGKCGARITIDMYACRPCWTRLPKTLRVPILKAWASRNIGDSDTRAAATVAHRAAMSEAHRWYVEHPPPQADAS